jgi:hypothetical protein
MRRLLAAAVGLCLSSATLAADDIPTRYRGAFPAIKLEGPITGTFSGETLRLRFASAPGKRLPRRVSLSCPWLSLKR